MKTCFVLFSLSKTKNYSLSFDPSLCGIFLNKEEAIKAQVLLTEDKRYVAFILELPLCQTNDDWLSYAKNYLKEKIVNETSKINLKPIDVEYKINRKKVDRGV